jgi:hypothetical protein
LNLLNLGMGPWLTVQSFLLVFAGPKWDVCGKAYDAVPIKVLAMDGRPRPHNPDDEKQARCGRAAA